MRKRSKYRPRQVHANAHLLAMQAAAIVPKHQRDAMAMLHITAIESLAKGKAGLNEFTALAGMVVMLMAADAGLGLTTAYTIDGCDPQKCCEALTSLAERWGRTRRLVATAAELATLRTAARAFDDLALVVAAFEFDRLLAAIKTHPLHNSLVLLIPACALDERQAA